MTDNHPSSIINDGGPSLNSSVDGPELNSQPPSMDPRVHFDKTTSKWQFEDDDGRSYEWIDSKQSWVPLIDEELWAEQQAAYRVEGVDENVPETGRAIKDKKQLKEERKSQSKRKRAAGSSSSSSTAPVQRNTAIYVTRLPLDTTTDELQECFSRAGLILVDDENRPKIKLYNDQSTGMFNGSALVVFLKAESVDLAIRLFDDTSLRLGETNQEVMKVSRAEFSHKQNSSETKSQDQSSSNIDKKEFQQKQKRAKKVEKLKSKLEEWDSDGEGSNADGNSKFSKVVVLQHMFTIEELESDPSLLIDLKEDVREECELLGNVTNVTLYDLEPEGVMTVKFKEPIAAQACIMKMNNRFFAGRQVKASIYDGKRRYKRSNGGSSFGDESLGAGIGGEAEEKKRLEAFAKFLEEDQ